MPENPSDRPTTNLAWARGGSPNQVTEPAAKRAAGWFEGTSPGSGDADKHPAGFENWLNREHGLHIEHLEGITLRQFDDWPAVWAAAGGPPAVGELLRIITPTSALYYRGEPYWTTTTTATGGGTVTLVCTDNEWIYYRSGSGNASVVAVGLNDGVLLWEQIVADNYTGLTCDGAYVYWARADTIGLFQRLKGTLAASASGGTVTALTELASNGSWVVGLKIGDVWFYNVAAATVVETGSASTTSAGLFASAIDDVQCYVGGTRVGTTDVWAYALSTRAGVWTAQLSTVAAPTVNSIATDGDVVYVATSRVAITGGFANLFALERTTGAILWSRDVGAAVDVEHIAVDDRYLYCATSGNAVFVFRLRVAAPYPPLLGTYPGTWESIAVDGISIVGSDGANACKRSWVGAASKAFQRVDGFDQLRRPFFTQMIPIDGRV